MSLLAPAALGLAALVIPLVVLYMLRSRRQRVEVPSTLLWERSDQSVTSAVPWQRLEVTPLLVLQLLILALLVFALARPFFAQASVLGPHTVFIIDSSGSMAAAGRFDAAIAEVDDLTSDISDANLVSLIEAGPQARIAGSFLRTRAAVADSLATFVVTGGSSDLDGAIRLGRSLATPDRPTNLVILSDGSSDVLASEPIVEAHHLKFSATAENLSISGLSVDPSSEGVTRVFINVTNHTPSRQEATIELSVNGLPAGQTDIEVAGLSDSAVTLPIEAGPGDVVVATRVGQGDGLDLDDTARLVVEGGMDRGVAVVGNGSTFLDVLLEIAPGFNAAEPGEASLLIVDGGPLPEIDRPTWLIRPQTAPEGVEFAELVTNVGATFQAPGEPILDGVDLSELAVSEAQVAETFSWFPIVRAGDVPLVLLGEVNGHRVAYFTFDITHSNLPVQVGFPIMGTRILQWLGGTGAGSAEAAVAGAPIALSIPAGSTAEVRRGGELVATLADTALTFVRTGTPGVYYVNYVGADGVGTPGPTVVRTFDRSESVAGSRDISVVAPTVQSSEAGSLIREWFPYLVTAALALMFVEWWLSHRRRRVRIREVAA